MVAVVVVVLVVTGVGLGGEEDVEECRALVEAQDVWVDEIDGEGTGMMSKEEVLSDKDEMRVRSEGGGLGFGGVAWAGFDSSHRPFLQQEDSRKSNRQEETQYDELRYRIQHTCSADHHATCSASTAHSF